MRILLLYNIYYIIIDLKNEGRSHIFVTITCYIPKNRCCILGIKTCEISLHYYSKMLRHIVEKRQLAFGKYCSAEQIFFLGGVDKLLLMEPKETFRLPLEEDKKALQKGKRAGSVYSSFAALSMSFTQSVPAATMRPSGATRIK